VQVKVDVGCGMRPKDGMYPVKIVSKRKKKNARTKAKSKRGHQLPFFLRLMIRDGKYHP
jgi:hypothetical protein